MKKCGRCKSDKNNDEFSTSQFKRSGGICRLCNTAIGREYKLKNLDKIKIYQQKYDAQYYQKNKQEILGDKKEYYQENKEEILEGRKEYYQENKEEKQEYNKSYYLDNKDQLIKNAKAYAINNSRWLKEYHSKYYKKRRISDLNFRIRTTVSANINYHLKYNNSSKGGKSCLNYLPYTIQELKEYLESQFESWMTWDNYGKLDLQTWIDDDNSTWTWQIDHIIPHSIFKYTSMKNQSFKKCWALENIRPLSAKQNFMDGVNRVRHSL